MASGVTRISDLIVPEIFSAYERQRTTEKSELISSGLIANSPVLSEKMAGGGLTFNFPAFNDLDNDEDNVSSDNAGVSTPNKISTNQQIAVRLDRNNSWSTADLAAALVGADPAAAIADRISDYWVRRLQTTTIALLTGVFADNTAAPTGTDTHTAGDLTVNISGAGYVAGVTDFSAEAFIDTLTLMGDAAGSLNIVFMHSVVYNRALKNNLIDFVPDSQGNASIPTFLGRRVIQDDGVPNPAGVGAAATAAGIYHTWISGAGIIQMGETPAAVPVEVERVAAANNGGGEETIHSRKAWCLHPVGHAYIGTPPVGGPSNAATANNLAHLDSWSRVVPQRKMVKLTRLITRES